MKYIVWQFGYKKEAREYNLKEDHNCVTCEVLGGPQCDGIQVVMCFHKIDEPNKIKYRFMKSLFIIGNYGAWSCVGLLTKEEALNKAKKLDYTKAPKPNFDLE